MKKLKTVNIDGQEFTVHIGNYPNFPMAMYIDLETADEMPWCTITKTFGNFYREGTFVPMGSTFIDTNNIPPGTYQPIIDALGGEQRVVFGRPYFVQSGYCEYPIYDFSLEKLREFDLKGTEEYCNTWKKEFVRLQNEMNENMF